MKLIPVAALLCAELSHQPGVVLKGWELEFCELGKFSVSGIEEQTIKSFKFNLYDSNLVVNVGVEYGDFNAVEKGKPTDLGVSPYYEKPDG